jgi:prepilin-type N-terminal cleavage/methylation domain-containing protein
MTLHRNYSSLRRGFTLIEIMVTGLIITACGLSIMMSINAGIMFQQSIREENGALRAAADLLDRTRRELTFRLEPWEQAVVIDNRGTLTREDDLMGTARIRFFAPDENGDYLNAAGQYIREVGTATDPIPMDLTMLMAEVTVTWNRIGRLSSTERQITLSSFLAP